MDIAIKQGAKVILADLRQEMGQALATELGENALFVRLDITSSAEWKKAIKLGESKFGNINVLVNNAGVLGPVFCCKSKPELSSDTVSIYFGC